MRLERAVAELPPDPEVVRRAFREFREFGALPDDTRLGGEVLHWVECGVDPTEFTNANDMQTVRFRVVAAAHRVRAEDEIMHELRREAVYAKGPIRNLARFLLEGMAEAGEDPTGPVLQKRGPPYPEWTCGSAAYSVIGWPFQQVAERYREQLRVVMAEFKQLGEQVKELSHDEQDEWFDRFVDADLAYGQSGVLPDDELLRAMVLVDTEFVKVYREGRQAVLADRSHEEEGHTAAGVSAPPA